MLWIRRGFLRYDHQYTLDGSLALGCKFTMLPGKVTPEMGTIYNSVAPELTHWGLETPIGDIDLGQH